MKDLLKGAIGVVFGLSLIINALFLLPNEREKDLNDEYQSMRAMIDERVQYLTGWEEDLADREKKLEESGTPISQNKSGLALFTSANAPNYMNENLFNSIHSMVYDNEAVFYIPYSATVAANEAGYNENRPDYEYLMADLWDQNRNRFVKKNKEFSISLESYDTDAYCTFFIVDDDDHEKILAIISDGTVYYDIAKHQGMDPFSMYNTRWNKYIRRDLSEILDYPNQAYLDPERTAKGLTEYNTDRVLFDNGEIRIIEKGTGSDALGWKLNLLIENHSFIDVRVECENESVNRYMMPSLFYADVLAGHDKTDAIYFTHEQLNNSRITDVQETGFSFVIFEKGTDRVIATSDWIPLTY